MNYRNQKKLKNPVARRHYESMSVTPCQLESGLALLTGSITTVALDVNEVEVENFQDGFDGASESEWTINFD